MDATGAQPGNGVVRCFTAKYDGRVSALRTPADIWPAYDHKKPPDPLPSCSNFQAIWDTGATHTVITQDVVDACGLKPTGMARVQTAAGSKDCETYLINVRLPNGVMFQQVRVTKGELGSGAKVLIGMDIIGTGDFAVTHALGKTVFSFRHPSTETIDFVAESQPTKPILASPKPGRNDLCSCGSGKKYKKCHGGPNPPKP